ncbi:MAG: hypothetical protein AB7N76_32380 [Planctomycetota bacterium]
MLSYTTLFADLEALFQGAGRDPASYRRLAREVRRVRASVDGVTREMAADYAALLLQRLGRADQGGWALAPEEAALLRGFLGLPPEDPELEPRLLADLGELEATVSEVLALKDQPLRTRHLEGLRRRLARLDQLAGRVAGALEEREQDERFQRATREASPAEREWLMRAIRGALSGEDLPLDESEETGGLG